MQGTSKNLNVMTIFTFSGHEPALLLLALLWLNRWLLACFLLSSNGKGVARRYCFLAALMAGKPKSHWSRGLWLFVTSDSFSVSGSLPCHSVLVGNLLFKYWLKHTFFSSHNVRLGVWVGMLFHVTSSFMCVPWTAIARIGAF